MRPYVGEMLEKGAGENRCMCRVLTHGLLFVIKATESINIQWKGCLSCPAYGNLLRGDRKAGEHLGDLVIDGGVILR